MIPWAVCVVQPDLLPGGVNCGVDVADPLSPRFSLVVAGDEAFFEGLSTVAVAIGTFAYMAISLFVVAEPALGRLPTGKTRMSRPWRSGKVGRDQADQRDAG